VRRRYDRVLKNFFAIYRPLASRWRVYDNAGGGEPRLIASGEGKTVSGIAEPDLWTKISERYDHGA